MTPKIQQNNIADAQRIQFTKNITRDESCLAWVIQCAPQHAGDWSEGHTNTPRIGQNNIAEVQRIHQWGSYILGWKLPCMSHSMCTTACWWWKWRAHEYTKDRAEQYRRGAKNTSMGELHIGMKAALHESFNVHHSMLVMEVKGTRIYQG